MKKKLPKIISGISILAGLAVLGAIFIWAPVCSGLLELKNGNMTHMKCFYMGQASIVLSIVLLIAGIESFLTSSRKPWTFIAIGILLLVVTFDSAIGIGICMKADMSCHTTALWIRSAGIITLAGGLISLFALQAPKQ